jgi:CheY-like chemotaxis protein
MSGDAFPAGETVMVVEDDVVVRTGIADYLRGCGYRVIEAAAASEAVQLLKLQETQIDIVLSGVQLGDGMNGFVLRRWISEHRSDVEVILVGTPAGAVDTAADLCESGPTPKNAYDPQTVLDRIKRALAAKGPSRKSA